MRRRVGCWVLVSSFVFSGCGAAPESESEPVGQVEQAVVDVARVLGFESTADWSVTTGTKSSSTIRTQGARSLALRNFSYVELRSVALPTLSGVTSTLAFDLRAPVSPAWGQAQLFVSIPSRGIYNQFSGQVSVAGMPASTFREIAFSLPANVVTALGQGYSDLTLTVTLNVPQTSQNYLFDNVRFGGAATPNLVELRVSDVDDYVYVTVNGVRRRIYYWGDPSQGQRIDVSSWFGAGANDLRIQTINTGGPASYHAELWVDGQLVLDELCPATLCNGADAPVGMLLNRQATITTPNRPARQTVQLTSGVAGKVYLNDEYTGLTTPASLSLPPGSYTFGLGVSTDAPFAYTGEYREQTVSVASAPLAVNLGAAPVLPLQDTTRIAILPVRDTHSPDASNVGVLSPSDVTEFASQAASTASVWFRPLTYGLAAWNVEVLPMVTSVPLVLPAPDAVPDTEAMLDAAGLQGLKQSYDIIVYYFSQHRPDGSPVDNASGYAWGGGGQFITISTMFTRGGGNAPNAALLHESLHNYEWYNHERLHFYNGVGWLHGAEEHGYDYEGDQGETDWLKWYRAFMRGQAADLAGMRDGLDWPSVPATGDLYTGVFPTFRRGFSPHAPLAAFSVMGGSGRSFASFTAPARSSSLCAYPHPTLR